MCGRPGGFGCGPISGRRLGRSTPTPGGSPSTWRCANKRAPGPLTASRAHVGYLCVELTERPIRRGANVVPLDSGSLAEIRWDWFADPQPRQHQFVGPKAVARQNSATACAAAVPKPGIVTIPHRGSAYVSVLTARWHAIDRLTTIKGGRARSEAADYAWARLANDVRHRGRVAEILDQLGLLDNDRAPAFQTSLERKLDGVTPGIRREVEDSIRTLQGGGPHASPAPEHPVGLPQRDSDHPARPVGSLRSPWEVSHDEILAIANAPHGNKRRHTLAVLRSLFGHCRKSDVILRYPTTRVRSGQNTYGAVLPPEDNKSSRRLARPPHQRPVSSSRCAAIHAAHTKDMRSCCSTTSTSVTVGCVGGSRPLDDLTYRALTQWLSYRRTHWPNTAPLP